MERINNRLSVIVPVYNVQEYLRRCLDSILSQSYEDLEIICVDDGSSDGSGGILDEYASKDARIKVMHRENGGVVSARQAGMRQVTGRYTTFVDPDDWMEPDMYQDMMAKMREHPVDLVASGFIRDYGSHTVCDPEKKFGLFTGDRLRDEIKRCLVDYERPFRFLLQASLCIKIYKSDLLKEFQLGIPGGVTVDTDTVCVYPYIMRCQGIYIMKECYYHYCQRENSCLNNLEIAEEIRNESIRKAYDYAGNLLPPNLVDYLKKYISLTVCPKYVMRYEDGELYPFGKIGNNSKVVIYSSGSFGRKAKRFIEENTDLRVVAWADKGGDGKTILRQEQLASVEYDYILICVLLSDIVTNICNDFEKLGIDMRKVKCIRRI